MEASLISFLLDKIGEIDQAQRTPPLDKIHSHIDRITAELKVMKTFLEGYNWSTIAAANEQLEAWIEQVKSVALKVEDIIDEYLSLVGEQRERTWKDHLSRPKNLCCNLAKTWHGIDSRLEATEKEILNLFDTKVRFGLRLSGNEDRIDSKKDTHHYQVYSPMLIEEDDLVGMEKNKICLLQWLTDADSCREMKIIVVWGKGGQGKTTLVANVCRNKTVKSLFECQVWVTISQNYSEEEVLRRIIKKIFKRKTESILKDISSTMRASELVAIIKESLRHKRYIVVLDDVWNENLLYELRGAFVYSHTESRLIVISRMKEAANITNEKHTLELQQLNEKDARILFCKKAFRRENNKDCPPKLKYYAGRILEKCQGSPLAIAVIGSLLSTKEKSESGWKEVYDCLCGQSGVRSIVNLCFNDLPCYLKNCFAYCSIFPEDYVIKRKKLIRLWVSEGFVEAKINKKVMEEEAEQYLAQLVDRSMLQVVQRNEYGRVKAFRMHDVVREVTLETFRKANFCMILDGSQSALDNPTRRLSIQKSDESLHLNKSLSQLRSLFMFSTSHFSPDSLRAVLISLKMLRVLELEDTSISNLPNEVSALFRLHYLGLRWTKVRQLPNDIQKLQNLQTLDLRDSGIKKLPHGVTQLKQLRHLFVSEIEVEFGGIGVGCAPILEVACQWKNLQTLRSFKATVKFVQLLGDMKELRSLEVVEVQQTHCPQLCTSLTKMRKLRCLRLFAKIEEQLDFETLNSPPPLLEKLDLSGKLFREKMPTFICSCAELVRVKLLWSQLTYDPVPSLGQLDKLVVLILGPRSYEGKKLHFRTGWFLNLKRLHLIRLKNLNSIEIEKGAVASLHELVMAGLPELKVVRDTEFLTHLQSLSLFGMPEELVGKLTEDI